QRFLRRVRMGTSGGIATYRPGEPPSQTMTAEALATRLLIGENVDSVEIAEAEEYLLKRLPGNGQDNYYYWYYATLALHQLQDDAWRLWNGSLQRRLLATQQSDGSWAADTVWGGYGGTVYTTSMGALCLEAYYRHTIRQNKTRIADQTGMRR
ncbi:MAG: squalene--hopene cyclase, partial [Planctomycetota bacterium]|nr:squalene--hopene cyclase [Planctomycetota bacterium]